MMDFLPQFEPLFVNDGTYRHKCFYGGRAGTKSHSVARALVLLASSRTLRILCAREVQNSIRDSVKRLLDDILSLLVSEGTISQSDFINTDTEIRFGNGSCFLFSGLRVNIESFKGFEGVDICWIEEAETVTERSLDMVLPTIRKPNSEIWYTFNPYSIHSPVYNMFAIQTPPPRSYVCKITYLDNPWASKETIEEAEHCKRTDPDKYAHVWMGEPVTVAKGAYYAKMLEDAKEEGRIDKVLYEPLLSVNTAWDLGVHDSTSIWFFQVTASGEYRIIDHYEASGESMQYYINHINKKPYSYGQHIAPHDIAVREFTTGKSRFETAASLGFHFTVCPQMGVADGINAVRNILPKCYFDAEKCSVGLKSLWAYQREFNDKMNEFKDKPLHDWSSHNADSFRYLAVGYNIPQKSMSLSGTKRRSM